jgi:hypothetical protein
MAHQTGQPASTGKSAAATVAALLAGLLVACGSVAGSSGPGSCATLGTCPDGGSGGATCNGSLVQYVNYQASGSCSQRPGGTITVGLTTAGRCALTVEASPNAGLPLSGSIASQGSDGYQIAKGGWTLAGFAADDQSLCQAGLASSTGEIVVSCQLSACMKVGSDNELTCTPGATCEMTLTPTDGGTGADAGGDEIACCGGPGDCSDSLDCCVTEGSECDQDYECCAGGCSDGSCAASKSGSCTAALGSRCTSASSCACTTDADCCQQGSGAMCAASTVAPSSSQRCCLSTGVPCGGDEDCCSGECDYSASTCD